MSVFHKFYDRYNDLIYNYKLSLICMSSDIFHTNGKTLLGTITLNADHYAFIVKNLGSSRVWTVGKRCLLLPGTWLHLWCFQRVRLSPSVTLNFSIYLIWTLILTAYDWTHWFWVRVVSFSWSRNTDFDYWFLFHLKWGSPANVTSRKGILTFSRNLIAPLVFLRILVTQFISLTCISYLCFKTDH
jgi:hypothetical protein